MDDAAKAEIIRNALQAEGIRCELDGELQAGFTGVWNIGVMVRAVDADRARSIIEAHQHHE